jgi:hypothetical protein
MEKWYATVKTTNMLGVFNHSLQEPLLSSRPTKTTLPSLPTTIKSTTLFSIYRSSKRGALLLPAHRSLTSIILIGGSLDWYNNPTFPPSPNKSVQPGLDPIFGQTGKEDQSVYRSMTGTNSNYEQELMSFPHRLIDPRGGEDFFAPSISTMRNCIAAR